jgi:hypothetical protein
VRIPAHLNARLPTIAIVGFFGLLLSIGIATYRDYGMGWDEGHMFFLGEITYDYVFARQPWPAPENLPHRSIPFYGPAFELALTSARHLTKTIDIRNILFQRHVLTFLFFVGGVAAFVALARRHTQDWRWGIAAGLLLVLHPRLYADAFYNSKDIPALVTFVFGMFTLLRFMQTRTPTSAMCHGVVCALAIATRLSGLFLLPLTAIGVLGPVLSASRHRRTALRHALQDLTICFAFAGLLTFVFWPYLWADPIGRFSEVLQFNSGQGAGSLYLGKMITALPWHYPFVWIAITTPPLVIAAAGVGGIVSARQMLKHPKRWTPKDWHLLLFFLWLLLPVATILAMGSGLFNGWRHIYFLGPAVLLFAVEGVRWLIRFLPRWRSWILAAMTVQLALVAAWMALNHPFQNVYFSLPSSLVQGNFELDYWGLSYRRGLEYILEHDPATKIPIFIGTSPGFSTTNNFLPAASTARFDIVESMEQAIYVITTLPAPFALPNIPPWHVISVDDIPILIIFRNPAAPPLPSVSGSGARVSGDAGE